jgi:ribonuclease D
MQYIQRKDDVRNVALALAGSKLIAADTEAAGYHRYHDRICLLQLSTRSETYIIDTLAITDLAPIASLFSDPRCEIVFHDADYDLRLLDRDFGMHVRGVFDTKVAAQFLGEPAFGLASLAEKYLGVKLEKKHQRADWAQRPLPADMLEYAAQDTTLLPELRDRLIAELESKGRLHWAEEEFRIAETVQWRGGIDDAPFLKIKNTRDLKPRQLAALRELHVWREELARERDVAPFRVVTNDVLVAVARAMPLDSGALLESIGVPPVLADRYGPEMLGAVARANQLANEDLPSRPRGPGRPQSDPALDARMELLKQARDRAADALGIDRGFLMPRAQLEEVARRIPKNSEELTAIPEIRRWQVEAAGSELVGALRDGEAAAGKKTVKDQVKRV